MGQIEWRIDMGFASLASLPWTTHLNCQDRPPRATPKPTLTGARGALVKAACSHGTPGAREGASLLAVCMVDDSWEPYATR